MQTEILRAYRFALDPTKAQSVTLARHAGAARWAFNHALAAKVAAHAEWRAQVEALTHQGATEKEARKKAGVRFPNSIDVATNWRRIRDLPIEEGGSPWHEEVATHCIVAGFRDADASWKNWLDSLSGRRAGRRIGYPRFKKKGRSRDSFRLHHDVKKPSIRMVGYRRLRLPKIGEVRLHGSGRELARAVDGSRAVVQSVTVSRRGHRWYAAVLCKVQVDMRVKPTKQQASRGTVGVDLGVKYLAALSQPIDCDDPSTQFIANPRHAQMAERRLVKAQRQLSRTQTDSVGRKKARRRVARLHHVVAERRASALHQLTKRLATGFATVAIEDLNVAGMTASARGSAEAPGKRVRQKAGLNRSLLDVSPGEFRRLLTYKTQRYGSKLALLDRWFPSSKTCSNCGWQNPSLTLSDRTFRCSNCHSAMDRDFNAARNIARHAVPLEQLVASDRGETQNARGVSVRPAARQGGRRGALKREDTATSVVPPRRSDPPTLRAIQDALF